MELLLLELLLFELLLFDELDELLLFDELLQPATTRTSTAKAISEFKFFIWGVSLRDSTVLGQELKVAQALPLTAVEDVAWALLVTSVWRAANDQPKDDCCHDKRKYLALRMHARSGHRELE